MTATADGVGPVPTLRLTLKPSRVGRALGLAAHGLAICALWLAALPTSMAVAGSLLATLSAWHWWRLPNFSWLLFESSGAIRGALADQVLVLERVGAPFVCPWLVQFTLRTVEGQRLHRVALFTDSAAADDLRKLRVLLRHR